MTYIKHYTCRNCNKVTDGSGDTPLHYAAENGHEEVVRLLVAAGALVSFGTATLVPALRDRLRR